MADGSSSVAIKSPCVGVCRLNTETALCDGCLRSIDEIAAWSNADDSQRQRILARIATRRAALPTSE